VLDRSHLAEAGASWQTLRRWKGLIDAVCEGVPVEGEGDSAPPPALPPPADVPPAPLLRALARYLELAGLEGVERLPRNRSPAALARLSAMQRQLGVEQTLQTGELELRLWRAPLDDVDSTCQRTTVGALESADEAWKAGDRALALHRLRGALAVSLHRSRHVDTLRSSLIEDPASHLAPLQQSVSYRALQDTERDRPALRRRPRKRPHAAGPWIPQVTVLPGAYGHFHQDMVDALGPRGVVRVPRLLRHPTFRRRRLSGADLCLLDALRAGEVDVMGQQWPTCPPEIDPGPALVALKALGTALRRADVVYGDWFDAASMWASHLVPAGTRLVIRAHGLDALDPWIHLVDWRGVDAVLTTQPLVSLLEDLTAWRGAPAPTPVLPYRPDLAQPPPGRDASARFTIGMVGWGRVVKDPAFALELLERDDRRRLVLIGPQFVSAGMTVDRSYATAFWQRVDRQGLRDRIHVVGRTEDVWGALGDVGVILSCSRRESFHLGLLEGAASGAVPVVRDWPLFASRDGARSLYPHEWVVPDLDAADRRIAELADEDAWRQASTEARATALERFEAEPVARNQRMVVLGGS